MTATKYDFKKKKKPKEALQTQSNDWASLWPNMNFPDRN